MRYNKGGGVGGENMRDLERKLRRDMRDKKEGTSKL